MKRSGGDEIFGGDIWEFWHSREPPKCSALLGRAPFQIGNWDEQENRTRTEPKGRTNNKSQNKGREKHTKTEKHIKTKTKVEKTNTRKAAPFKLETGMSRRIGQGQKQRDTRTTKHKKGQRETHKNKNKDG